MEKVGSVFELMKVIASPPMTTTYPLNMEQANHVRNISFILHVFYSLIVSLSNVSVL